MAHPRKPAASGKTTRRGRPGAQVQRPTGDAMKALCLALLATLGGCATLAASEHAQLLASAAADDQACLQQGWKYPEPRYVSCRLQLQDDRLHQDWLNLQLMHQTQAQQPNNIPAPYDP